VMDFLKEPGTIQFVYDANLQIRAQVKAVAFTLVYSGVLTALIGFLVHKTIGLRVSSDIEREGLDLAEHGERAYSY
jgi:ammonium transporter, Amt family